MNCVVFGAGAWGTAFSLHLSRQGHTVTLVPRRIEQALELATTRENKDYLAGYKLPLSIQIGLEAVPALMDADIVFLAYPSKGLADLLKQIGPSIKSSETVKMVVSLTKGLDQKTLERPCEQMLHAFGKIPVGTLNGPSNAQEVARAQPTAMVLASNANEKTLSEVQAAISGPSLRTYTSTDIAGVEIGGTLKNVYALGAGLCDGLKLGDNAKAAFLTRALQEMMRVGQALGGKSETFLGLSGVGDLMATAHGSWSRNRALGEAIARNATQALAELASRRDAVEGHRATETVSRLAKSRNVDAPILFCLNKILFEGLDARAGVTALMTRDLKSEI
ncbi:MAG: NAD(P)-dependent glycerol-3-phosphate dehydrogenase [Opitutales bacterium]|jgi:glycerol-3-phosphate dehydrogenase (NAD(P)+)|nr:NAD(P)-dependent glycerol-3-phosphate dehydrogenase [Opitutales bacterium]